MSTVDTENVVVDSNVDTDTLTSSTSQELDRQIRLIEDTIKLFRNQVSELKRTRKEIVNLEKENDKLAKKKAKKANTGNRKGGFTQPTEVNDELADFLGIERGSALPRSRVTSLIKDYVHQHQLLNPDNKREFRLNDTAESKALEALFNPDIIYRTDNGTVMVRAATEGKEDSPLGYFNLQSCIKHQFGKTVKTESTEAVTETVTATTEASVTETTEAPKAKKTAKKVKAPVTETTEASAPVESTAEASAPAKKVVKKKIIRKKA